MGVRRMGGIEQDSSIGFSLPSLETLRVLCKCTLISRGRDYGDVGSRYSPQQRLMLNIFTDSQDVGRLFADFLSTKWNPFLPK